MADKPLKYKRRSLRRPKDKKYKRMTTRRPSDLKDVVQDFVEYIMGTRLQSCLKEDCLHNNLFRSECSLKHMSLGTLGECTFYAKRNEKKE